jgi:hypothetical protein
MTERRFFLQRRFANELRWLPIGMSILGDLRSFFASGPIGKPWLRDDIGRQLLRDLPGLTHC